MDIIRAFIKNHKWLLNEMSFDDLFCDQCDFIIIQILIETFGGDIYDF